MLHPNNWGLVPVPVPTNLVIRRTTTITETYHTPLVGGQAQQPQQLQEAKPNQIPAGVTDNTIHTQESVRPTGAPPLGDDKQQTLITPRPPDGSKVYHSNIKSTASGTGRKTNPDHNNTFYLSELKHDDHMAPLVPWQSESPDRPRHYQDPQVSRFDTPHGPKVSHFRATPPVNPDQQFLSERGSRRDSFCEPIEIGSKEPAMENLVEVMEAMKLKTVKNSPLRSRIVTEELVDGSIYEGEMVGNVRHGQGKMKYFSGELYDGEWAFNQREGYGMFTIGGEKSYEGEWRKNKAHGRGIWNNTKAQAVPHDFDRLHLNPGDIGAYAQSYEGEFFEGVFQGHGTLIMTDGTRYNGNFVHGGLTGTISVETPEGDFIIGVWENHKLVKQL